MPYSVEFHSWPLGHHRTRTAAHDASAPHGVLVRVERSLVFAPAGARARARRLAPRRSLPAGLKAPRRPTPGCILFGNASMQITVSVKSNTKFPQITHTLPPESFLRRTPIHPCFMVHALMVVGAFFPRHTDRYSVVLVRVSGKERTSVDYSASSQRPEEATHPRIHPHPPPAEARDRPHAQVRLDARQTPMYLGSLLRAISISCRYGKKGLRAERSRVHSSRLRVG